MPKVLLSVSHHQQQSDGDCLAACAAMAITHLGQTPDYVQLLKLLKVKPHGAPAGNIRLLESLDLAIVYSQTDMSGLETMLEQGWPVIVFVRTGELPYWTYSTDHALLIVGYDEHQIYVNDPAHAETPIVVPRADFELAWLERDYFYALITTPVKK